MIRLLVVSVFCVLLNGIYAQDMILLMNGREWKGKISSDDGTVLVLTTENRKGKTKNRQILKNDIFSYTKAGQPEVVLYVQDEIMGDFYSVAEMEVFIQGEQDAQENYEARMTGLVGFALSGTAAYLAEGGLIGSIAVPLAYSIFQLAPKIMIKEKYMSDPNYKFNDLYADGFEPVARSEKILTAMGYSFIGAAAGVAVYALINGGL